MNVLKVGYTFRSVPERLNELATTGVPGSFVWEYGALVESPDSIEKKVHRSLRAHRVAANREFFDCSLPVAVAAVLSAIQHTRPRRLHDRSLVEAKAASLREKQAALAEKRTSAEKEISAKERALYSESDSLRPGFLWFWVGHAFLAALLVDAVAPVKTELGLFILSAIVGSITGYFHLEHVYDKRKSAASIQPRLNELQKQRDFVNEIFAEHLAQLKAEAANPEVIQPKPILPNSTRRTDNKPQVAPTHDARAAPPHTQTLEQRIQEVESRVIREIPYRFFACDSCGRRVNLNVKNYCSELRCPAKLLADA